MPTSTLSWPDERGTRPAGGFRSGISLKQSLVRNSCWVSNSCNNRLVFRYSKMDKSSMPEATHMDSPAKIRVNSKCLHWSQLKVIKCLAGCGWYLDQRCQILCMCFGLDYRFREKDNPASKPSGSSVRLKLSSGDFC